jgi:hypothetical protein
VRGWVLGLAAGALVTVLIGLLGSAGSTTSCSGPNGQPCASHVPPLGPDGEPVSDGFYFVHRPLAGDGSITVRVSSLTGQYPSDDTVTGPEPWAKAGIIIKDGSTPGSPYAAVMVTGGNGVRMQYDYTHDTAGLPGAVSAAAPRWLRLTRSGTTVTGAQSTDGSHWTDIATVTLPGLPSTVQAGLFTTSPDHTVTTQSFGGGSTTGGSTVATAVFDRTALAGAWPSGGWTGQDMNSGDGGNGTSPRFEQSGDRFTISGTGDIAPGLTGRGIPSKTIENGLAGAFAGLIAMVVIATTFLTAEYRRGLVRTTFAATPRRRRVLAAKTVVVGAVTFVTGLVAAAVSVPLVEHMETAKGFYVVPQSMWTEARVVVGTAALLAVASVLASAVGVVLRRSAAAVTTVIVAVVLPYVLATASVLPVGAAEWLLRITPDAAFAVQQSTPAYPQVTADYTPANGYYPLPPAAGFAVLCAYTVLALCVATVLLRRRDV